MLRLLAPLLFLFASPATAAHYLFVWTGDHPREVARLSISATFRPHWTGWDPKTGRIVATATEPGDRTYLLTFDPTTGALAVDTAFRGDDGEVGFSFGKRTWPHGWTGEGKPHGAVFSR